MNNKKIHKYNIAIICCAAAFLIGASTLTVVSNIPANTYTVEFLTKGGSEISSQKVKKGSKVSKPITTRKGYDLDKWTYNGKSWDFANDTVKENMTLIARWDAINYSINYDYDGGTATNVSTYTIEDEITFHVPVKEDHSFSTFVDQYGNNLTSIEKGTTGDLNLTAKYDKKSYFVSVNAEPGDGTIYGEGTYSAGDAVTLSYVDGNKYKISCWTYILDGVSHFEENKSQISFTMPHGNVEVNLGFETKTFKVTYHYDGDIYSSHTNPSVCRVGETYELESLFNSDYDFLGWYNKDNVRVASIHQETAEDLELWARWAKKEYLVSVKCNSSYVTIDGAGYYMWGDIVSLKITDNGTVSIDYSFDKEPEDLQYDALTSTYTFTMPKEDVNMTISTGNSTFNVQYNGVDGLTNNNPTTCSYHTSYTLESVSKDSYNFLGWFDDNDNKVETIYVTEHIDNYVLTAKWAKKEYAFTVNCVGDNVSASGAGNYAWGETVTLKIFNAGTVAISSVEFSNEPADLIYNPDTTTYTFTMPKENLSVDITGETLSFTVSYDGVDGLTNNNPTSCKYFTSYTLEDVSKDSSNFLGWYDEDDNKVESIYLATQVDNYVLTAKWELKKCVVTITKGSTDFVTTGAGTYSYGDEVTLTVTDDKCPNNGMFAGWYVDDEPISFEREYTFTITEDMDVTAKYVDCAYHIITGNDAPITDYCYNSDGTSYSSIEYTYDESGNLVKLISDYVDYKYIYNYEYDANGNQTLYEYTRYVDETESSYYHEECTYDENNNKLTEKYGYKKDSYSTTITYKYDSNNRLIEENDSYGTVTYEYNTEGDLIKKTYPSYYVTYTIWYEDDIKYIKELASNVNEEYGQYYISAYDNEGKEISYHTYSYKDDTLYSCANNFDRTFTSSGLVSHEEGYCAMFYDKDWKYYSNDLLYRYYYIVDINYGGQHNFDYYWYDSSDRVTRKCHIYYVPETSWQEQCLSGTKYLYTYED